MKILVRLLSLTSIVLGIALPFGSTYAADTSAWVEDSYSAIRLVSGTSNSTGSLLGGIEIKMKPGWHTYWRYPGDSGVPPRFSFAGSDNVADAKVLFPAPHSFTDETGTTIGYKESVIFPVRIRAQQKGKPVTLRAKIDYAVCAKLCVPSEARLELTIPPNGSADNAALDAAASLVPKLVSAAEAGLTVKRTDSPKTKPLVLVDLSAPAGKPVDLFVEGPSPEWSLPIPQPAPGAPPGHRRFGFELDGLPPGTDPKGSYALTFTIVTGGRATEVKTHLD